MFIIVVAIDHYNGVETCVCVLKNSSFSASIGKGIACPVGHLGVVYYPCAQVSGVK